MSALHRTQVGPARPKADVGHDGLGSPTSTLAPGKAADISDKSPNKSVSMKAGTSHKELRQAKREKKQARNGLTR